MNIGLEENYNYFTTEFMEAGPLSNPDDSIFKIVYQTSLDSTINSRSVYGVLNWVGDVGGFSGLVFMILAYVGNWFA